MRKYWHSWSCGVAGGHAIDAKIRKYTMKTLEKYRVGVGVDGEEFADGDV